MMHKDITTTDSIDIESRFLDEISLWTIIGNKQSVNKLRILSLAYLNDKSEQKEPSIKPIIFCGSKCSGRTVMAHAYAHSMGTSQLFTMDGVALSIPYFLNQGNEFGSYLVYDADSFTAYTSQLFFDAVSKRELTLFSPFERNNIRKEPFYKLLMIAVNDIKKIGAELVKRCVVCFLNGVSADEIFQILEQRIIHLKWSIESEIILENITSVCNEKVDLAINILGWSYRVARAEGEDVIKEKHLNCALHLMQHCEGNK